ncbi:MAG: hypothetical protein NVS2B7_25800 [Herpetosiphon sp.]
MARPSLIFFCELAADELVMLFNRPDVTAQIAALHAGIALAMPDLSAERASIVRQLTDQGIPVIGWLLLPREQGYWFNVQNYPHALAAYQRFHQWATAEKLQFAGVGLDIEPSVNAAGEEEIPGVLAFVYRRWQSSSDVLYPAAQPAYRDLVSNIRHDGYVVYAYQIPLIIDDRRAKTTILQRLLSIVDLPVDHEVLMCYSSLLPLEVLRSDLNGALVGSYGIHADGLAIGSTGGIADPETGVCAPQLSWQSFTRDLQIAAKFVPTLHIYSLEGCVEQGWLEKLGTVNWDEVPHIPLVDRMIIDSTRNVLAVLLFSSRFGLATVGWIGWLAAAYLFVRYRSPRLLRLLQRKRPAIGDRA